MTSLNELERGFTPSFKVVGSKLPWTTLCDGMPRLTGCGNEIETSVPYKRPGLKSSGWLITYGHDGYKDDKTFLCAFCPECAVIVQQQMKENNG